MSAKTQSPDHPMRVAHSQLRFVVLACCWLIGISLVTQVLVWSLISFTDIRSADSETASSDVPLVVKADEPIESAIFSPAQAAHKRNVLSTHDSSTSVFSIAHYDRFLSAATSSARTLGTLSVLTLCPLVAIGLLLAAVCGAHRLDRGISAFSWSIVLALLILPIGAWIGLPWPEGALSTYSSMLREVESARFAANGGGFDLQFYSRFLILPSLCLLGFIMLGIRFSGSVKELLVIKDSHKLDPTLELETADIQATSLHGGGGRFSRTLSRTVKKNEEQDLKKPQNNIILDQDKLPTATKVASGEAPKRLI